MMFDPQPGTSKQFLERITIIVALVIANLRFAYYAHLECQEFQNGLRPKRWYGQDQLARKA